MTQSDCTIRVIWGLRGIEEFHDDDQWGTMLLGGSGCQVML